MRRASQPQIPYITATQKSLTRKEKSDSLFLTKITFYIRQGLEKADLKESGKADIRKAHFLAVDE